MALEIVFSGKKSGKDVTRTLSIDKPKKLTDSDITAVREHFIRTNAVIVGDGPAIAVTKIAYVDSKTEVLYDAKKKQ